MSAQLRISPAQWAAFEAAGTTAHRISSLGGAWSERLGNDLLFNHQDDFLFTRLVEEWRALAPELPFQPERLFSRPLPLHNEERQAPVLFEGSADLPVETVVSEAHMKFGIDFSAGYSVGLFLDQRENRARVRAHPPKRMLNTFAYTCSFSVAAALGGAETVSVDLSRKSLNRGAQNFTLNGLDPKAHRFIADDVLDVLPRLARRGEKFDCIILDPPTFSRGNKGRRFQAEQHLESLLAAALEVAAPRARILLSTNCTRIQTPDLEAMCRFALKAGRRTGGTHHCPRPVDFPAGADARTVWLDLH